MANVGTIVQGAIVVGVSIYALIVFFSWLVTN
jgi:hypothetical protein